MSVPGIYEYVFLQCTRHFFNVVKGTDLEIGSIYSHEPLNVEEDGSRVDKRDSRLEEHLPLKMKAGEL